MRSWCRLPKGVPQALIDSESREGWIKKANTVNEKVTELGKEAATILVLRPRRFKRQPGYF